MEEYVYVIRSYLPVEFAEAETNEFIMYLIDAYLENLPTKKYQFAFSAFHMLYMSFIYKTKWFLKERGNVKIEESLQDFAKANRGATFNTLFDLSQLPEKTSLEKVLKSLSFHINEITICKNLVDVRNNCLHASGKIWYKRQLQVENYIEEEIENVKHIQKKIKPYLKTLLEQFIDSNWNNTWIDSDLNDWIINNYLSQKELEEILEVRLPFMKQGSNTPETFLKKILYSSLIGEMLKYLDDKEKDFTNSLSILMTGIVPQIDIRRNPKDSEKLKNTQELIEEKILPILTNLSNEEALKAQQVLKLNEETA